MGLKTFLQNDNVKMYVSNDSVQIVLWSRGQEMAYELA